MVEIDITPADIDKLQLFAAKGIPEFWRYSSEVWQIYYLREGVYEELVQNINFPIVAKVKLYEFLGRYRMRSKLS